MLTSHQAFAAVQVQHGAAQPNSNASVREYLNEWGARTRKARRRLSSCCTSFRPPSERPCVMYSWHTPVPALHVSMLLQLPDKEHGSMLQFQKLTSVTRR